MKKNKSYYQALGVVKAILSSADYYRYKTISRLLSGRPVLDIGSGDANFLNLIKTDYQIAETEVNQEKVDFCNRQLGARCRHAGQFR